MSFCFSLMKPLLAGCLAACLAGCEENDFIPLSDFPDETHTNPPIVLRSDTLRILAIGNSYTRIAIEWIDTIAAHLNADHEKFCIYAVTVSDKGLDYWAQAYRQHEILHLERQAGAVTVPSDSGTLEALVRQPWDMVMLQQISSRANDSRSFHPYIDTLVNVLRRECPNPDVIIVWHNVWARLSEEDETGDMNQRWNIAASLHLLNNGYVDVIVPVCQAVQYARHSPVNTPHYLTRDGSHLTEAVGTYIASATLFETLLAPVFHCSATDDNTVHIVTDYEKSWHKYETVNLDDSTRSVALGCVLKAVAAPFTPFKQ